MPYLIDMISEYTWRSEYELRQWFYGCILSGKFYIQELVVGVSANERCENPFR